MMIKSALVSALLLLVTIFSLNLNFGRKYNAVNKRLENTDTDAGIMTGTKK